MEADNREPVPVQQLITVINNQKERFVEYALNEAEKIGSIVEEYEEFQMHGIRNVRVINTLALCKSRFYARLIMLQIPQQDYTASKFLVFLPEQHFSFDEKQTIGDDIVFYKYLLMEEHTTPLMKWARSMTPKYGDKQIMARLAETCPVFCKLVKFKYLDYQYELVRYPDSTIPRLDIMAVAAASNLKEGEVELLEEQYIDEPIDYEDFNRPSDITKWVVDDAVYVSKRTTFSFAGRRFGIDQSLVYWVKERQTTSTPILKKVVSLVSGASSATLQNYYDEGRRFDALFLQDGNELSLLRNNLIPSVKDMLGHLFSRRFERARLLYNNTPDRDIPFLFEKKVFENNPSTWKSMRPGTILYQKTPPRPGTPPIHFAVYLGNSRVLHTNFNLDVTEAYAGGSFFRIEGIEGFMDMKKTTLVNALIPLYLPFTFDEINELAKQFANRKLLNEELNRDNENMPFEFMFGMRFAYKTPEGKVCDAAWLENMVNDIKNK